MKLKEILEKQGWVDATIKEGEAVYQKRNLNDGVDVLILTKSWFSFSSCNYKGDILEHEILRIERLNEFLPQILEYEFEIKCQDVCFKGEK